MIATALLLSSYVYPIDMDVDYNNKRKRNESFDNDTTDQCRIKRRKGTFTPPIHTNKKRKFTESFNHDTTDQSYTRVKRTKRTFKVSPPRPIHTNKKRKINETFDNDTTTLQELPPSNSHRVKRSRPNSQNKEMAFLIEKLSQFYITYHVNWDMLNEKFQGMNISYKVDEKMLSQKVKEQLKIY